jgi:hypothetical protein
MENEDILNLNSDFVSLIMMLASACWQQLGRVPNPMSGQIEKELSHAQLTIDLLTMLRDKTKGNLSTEEDRLINTTISDLQANYSDEMGKGNSTTVN